MPTTIKLKNSVTTTNAPSSLVQGEVAINITDKKVWVGNAATTPIQLLGDGGSVTFTSLTVTGVSTFSAGTVSAPSITTTGDTNTGIYFPAADTIAFTEGGTESMRIDSSGNVGIGTSSPVTKLNISGSSLPSGELGTLAVTGNTTAKRLSIGVDSSSTMYAWIQSVESGVAVRDLSLQPVGGNVGIGTSSPNISGVSKAVTLNTTNGTSGAIYEIGVNGTNYAYLFANASNTVLSSVQALPLLFNTTNTERMRIDSSGNVFAPSNNASTASLVVGGNGTTTNLGARICVRSPISAGASLSYAMHINDSNTNIAGGANFIGWSHNSEDYSNGNVRAAIGATIDSGGRGALLFRTGGFGSQAERMRITFDGNLVVGATSSGGNRFVSKLDTNTSNNVPIYAGNNSSGNSGLGTYDSSLGTGNASNTNCYHFRGITENVAIYYLYGNGTSSFTSDARLKKNVETARNGYLDDLMKLRLVKYQWKANEDSSPKELGLIAQEVEQVFAGLVQDADVEIDGITPKVLKASVIPFMLLKAIQEQQALIETLTTRLNALEGK
jgi:hypothetical protein